MGYKLVCSQTLSLNLAYPKLSIPTNIPNVEFTYTILINKILHLFASYANLKPCTCICQITCLNFEISFEIEQALIRACLVHCNRSCNVIVILKK